VNGVRYPPGPTSRDAGEGLVACPSAAWDESWVARQERCPLTQAPLRLRQIEQELVALVTALTARVCGRALAPEAPQFGPYLQRLHGCLAYHWIRLARDGPVVFGGVVARLAPEKPAEGGIRGDLLAEVLLAQALQLGEPRAAELFEAEYMPLVRGTAQTVGGQRAREAVENFAAELVLPRAAGDPRIATYLGRTPLAYWLVPVVVNYWRTVLRQRVPISLAFVPERPARDTSLSAGPEAPCEGLLQPIFAHTAEVLAAPDRLLLQMLLLDRVPQKELAQALGLNSGTITRRRQKAMGALLERVRQLAAVSPRPGDVANCLQLVLAGDDPELRRRLAAVLARGVRGADAEEPGT
jgi:DNA-directed RNA polymerase specialized sigma24 family protein